MCFHPKGAQLQFVLVSIAHDCRRIGGIRMDSCISFIDASNASELESPSAAHCLFTLIICLETD